MSLSLKSLFVETITAPRDAAQRIIDLGITRQTSIICVIFTICITVILFFLDLNSSPSSIILPLLMHHPLVLASVMIFGTLWSAFVIGFFGKILGGNENIDNILVLIGLGAGDTSWFSGDSYLDHFSLTSISSLIPAWRFLYLYMDICFFYRRCSQA